MIVDALDIAPLPPEEAIAWFKAKGFRISWDWHEMWQADHARAFTVAKVAKVDILQDIFSALDKAQSDGITFETFRKELTPLLQSKGWWGRQEAVNLTTGELKTVQLGSPRRLRTIFNVNVQTALQVGHYRAMTDPAVLAARPYWRYSAVMDGHTRPMHRQWHGLILPADHPFWATHFPPNGWNCRCTVVSMSLREMARDGLKVSEPPEIKMYKWVNPAIGGEKWIPQGIDAGWDYNPGTSANAHIRQVAEDTAKQATQQIGWALLNDLKKAEAL